MSKFTIFKAGNEWSGGASVAKNGKYVRLKKSLCFAASNCLKLTIKRLNRE